MVGVAGWVGEGGERGGEGRITSVWRLSHLIVLVSPELGLQQQLGILGLHGVLCLGGGWGWVGLGGGRGLLRPGRLWVGGRTRQ